ncbi:hypothetical protein JW960_05040 [candidate division KSB1 bacterium]|nr:hypothetical protein [candidate division KSB1 bacterium]
MELNHISHADLQEYVENEVGQAKRQIIERHLQYCAQCRQELAHYQSLSTALNRDIDLQINPDFADIVLHRLEANIAQRRFGRWLFVIAGLASGLILLIALIIFTRTAYFQNLWMNTIVTAFRPLEKTYQLFSELLAMINIEPQVIGLASVILLSFLFMDYIFNKHSDWIKGLIKHFPILC